MLATQSIASDVQLRVPAPAAPHSSPRLEHADTIIVTDENQSPELTQSSPSRTQCHCEQQSSHGGVPTSPDSRADDSGISLNQSSVCITGKPTNNASPATAPLHSGKDSKLSSQDQGVVRYGELVVLGYVTLTQLFERYVPTYSSPTVHLSPTLRYNGCLPGSESGRKRSKFTLHRRQTANGVKPSKKQFVTKPRDPKVGSFYQSIGSTCSSTLDLKSDKLPARSIASHAFKSNATIGAWISWFVGPA